MMHLVKSGSATGARAVEVDIELESDVTKVGLADGNTIAVMMAGGADEGRIQMTT